MTPQENERMLDLCRRFQNETDPKKVVALVAELHRFLDSKETPKPVKRDA